MASSAAPKPKPSRTDGASSAVEQHDPRGPQQTEPDDGQADHSPGAEGNAGPFGPGSRVHRGRGDAEVRASREPHAEVPDRGREAGPDDEGDRAAHADARVTRQHEEQPEDHDDEEREGPELPTEVRRGPLLDRERDLLHAVRALGGGEHLAPEHDGDDEGQRPDHRDRADDDKTGGSELEHPSSLTTAPHTTSVACDADHTRSA